MLLWMRVCVQGWVFVYATMDECMCAGLGVCVFSLTSYDLVGSHGLVEGCSCQEVAVDVPSLCDSPHGTPLGIVKLIQ